MARHYLFSSESVTEGHPDKVCDTISDRILDACLAQDPKSRVACETLAKGNVVVLAGEITTSAKFDYLAETRAAIREIGYTNKDCMFQADTCQILCALSEQSHDIAQGVDDDAHEGKDTDEQGAGDQGLMFGYRHQRDARTHAGADSAQPPPGPGTGPAAQERGTAVAAAPTPRRRFPWNTRTTSPCGWTRSSSARSTRRTSNTRKSAASSSRCSSRR